VIIGIFLDISGTFNNLRLKVLIKYLMDLEPSEATRSIIESYLEGRSAMLKIEKSSVIRRLTRGCSQGSQLGPTLWKVAMEQALRIVKDNQIKVIAYAVDLAVIVAGREIEDIIARVGIYLEKLKEWSCDRSLSFPRKSQRQSCLKEILGVFGFPLVMNLSIL